MPCFNEAANARSVISWTGCRYPNYDIIAVNDGKDRTGEILNELAVEIPRCS